MIPFIQIPSLEITSFYSIQPFGVLVVCAVAAGQWYIRRRALHEGFVDDEAVEAIIWAVCGGFLVSHFVDAVFYTPEKIEREGILFLFKFWDGLSSTGGFIGGFFGILIFSRIKKKQFLKAADLMMQGLCVGWVFGRMGCAIAHDHKGKLTDFWMGVQFPGGTRHDLGLYEFLFTALILVPVVVVLPRFKPRAGTYLTVVTLLYAPVRLGWDFLRVEGGRSADPRMLGMTFAQYMCIVFFLGALWMLPKLWKGRVQALGNASPNE